MTSEEDRDVRPATEYLRQMAPTQTHSNARKFRYTADLLEGLKLETDADLGPLGRGPSTAVINWPIKVDDNFVGYVSVTVFTDEHGGVHVSSQFEPTTDIEPMTAPPELSPSEEDRVTDRMDASARRGADEKAAKWPDTRLEQSDHHMFGRGD